MFFSLFRLINLRFITILLFGFIVLCGPVKADDTEAVNAHPALWQVEKGDGKIYLLGSFHVLPTHYKWFNGILRTSFENSRELVLEAEITPESTAEIQAKVIKNAFFAGEDNLKNHLDDAHYDKMLSYAKKLMGLDEATARKSKPWFMAIQMSLISFMSNGMDPNSGVDKFLEGIARQEQKVISGLETPLDSMTALIDHPLTVQSAMLSDTLDKLDEFKSYMNDYLEAWASGDAARLAKTMVEDMAEQPEMYQALLVDRNDKWLPAIEGYINSGKTTFIVVGAAHLVGPDGIVKLLRAKGYKVDKIQ